MSFLVYFYSKSGYFFSHAYAAILDKYVKYAQMPLRLLFCLQEAEEIKNVGVEDQLILISCGYIHVGFIQKCIYNT